MPNARAPLASPVDPWRMELGQGLHLRHAWRRDLLALTWLLNTGAHVHNAPGHESLRDLLRTGCGLVLASERSIQAALLPSPDRKPVALARCLAIRSQDAVALYFDGPLSEMERRLAQMGFAWLAFHACPAWLTEEIARRGYAIQNRILGFRRPHVRIEAPAPTSHAIRRATLEDAHRVLDVDHAAFEPFWRLNILNIRRAARFSPYVYLIEDIAQQVQGYLIAEGMGARGYVSRIAVRPEAQRRGLGAALMGHTLARMARDGLTTVELDTQADNGASQALYTKLGFENLGEVDAYWAKELRDDA